MSPSALVEFSLNRKLSRRHPSPCARWRQAAKPKIKITKRKPALVWARAGSKWRANQDRLPSNAARSHLQMLQDTFVAVHNLPTSSFGLSGYRITLRPTPFGGWLLWFATVIRTGQDRLNADTIAWAAILVKPWGDCGTFWVGLEPLSSHLSDFSQARLPVTIYLLYTYDLMTKWHFCQRS